MAFKINLQKIKRNYRDYGSAITIKKIILKLFNLFYENQTYRIYRMRLSTFFKNDHNTDHFYFKFIKPEEDFIINQIECMEEWLNGAVKKRLINGSICLVALDHDVVAGFNLISFGDIYMPIINLKRKFKLNEAWSEQTSVSIKYRRRGLATSLRYNVYNELMKKGIKRFYGGTHLSNIASQKLQKKVGSVEIADIHYKKLFFYEKWTFNRIKL